MIFLPQPNDEIYDFFSATEGKFREFFFSRLIIKLRVSFRGRLVNLAVSSWSWLTQVTNFSSISDRKILRFLLATDWRISRFFSCGRLTNFAIFLPRSTDEFCAIFSATEGQFFGFFPATDQENSGYVSYDRLTYFAIFFLATVGRILRSVSLHWKRQTARRDRCKRQKILPGGN